MNHWWPRPVPLRLRVFFRGAFLLLTLAIIALGLFGLREEKQLSYRAYRDLFDRSTRQINARLQHPSGQLALLNPVFSGSGTTSLHPLLLPYSGLDFDDRSKAQRAAEMAGCLVQYPDGAQLCVAVGNSPVGGGFLYAVGSFNAGELRTHTRGDLDLTRAHRLVVDVSLPERHDHWIAPLESDSADGRMRFNGRLTGFATNARGQTARRPDHEFRGWLWQDPRCLAAPPDASCRRRTFFSLRLPVNAFSSTASDDPRLIWPPPDLAQIRVHIQALAPDAPDPLFDSTQAGVTAPFALADLKAQLLAGESLTIRRLLPGTSSEVISFVPEIRLQTFAAALLRGLVARLPVSSDDQPLSNRQIITTPVGSFEILLRGEPHSSDAALSLLAGRLVWFLAAILTAIVLTWAAIERRIIHRITLLTRRAAAFQLSPDRAQRLQLDLRGLSGGDELGLLAARLSDLLQRINEDARREQLRCEQQKNLWHAVGHEIMAPLQSLSALHARPDDPSVRYVNRMRQAMRVLYGSASPSDAFLSASVTMQTLDADAFLRTLADNAADAGIARVRFESAMMPVMVQAEEYSLEDVVTHILNNADRYRPPGTDIRLTLRSGADAAEVRIHNSGPRIAPTMLSRVFEYGVSDAGNDPGKHRGQGLFVARTYMAKMGGTIEALNVDDGVEFVLRLAAA